MTMEHFHCSHKLFSLPNIIFDEISQLKQNSNFLQSPALLTLNVFQTMSEHSVNFTLPVCFSLL